jgi:hypothetical protein
MGRLLERYGRWIAAEKPVDERICQGTLLSRAQYLVDIGKWGYRDARLAPLGNMSGEEIAYWTWAIDNVK